MNFLVTGGAGFIGSHLCESLLASNHKVICLDNFNDFYDPEVKRNNISHITSNNEFQLYEGDILNDDLLNSIMENNDIDVVIHLAAMAGVRASVLDPITFYQVNVIGTLKVLKAMQVHHIRNMVFASSSSIYGNNEKIPFSEFDAVDNPISPYAASKKSGELLCYTYYHLYNFNINCLRFFTVYGPRQRPDLAIHKFTRAIINDDPITLYGDGSSSRDYTHVSDIIAGIINSLNYLDGYEIINLGGSKPIALIDLIKLIEKYTGKKANLNFVPKQPGDVDQTYADINKAKYLIGYAPKISIERGIKDFISWYKPYVFKGTNQNIPESL